MTTMATTPPAISLRLVDHQLLFGAGGAGETGCCDGYHFPSDASQWVGVSCHSDTI